MLRSVARFAQVSKSVASAETVKFTTPLSKVAEKIHTDPLAPAVHPGLDYTACKIFAGDVPLHKIPAQDGPEFKNGGIFSGTPMQINYGPGRYDYGRIDEPRGLLRILRTETHWSARQVKYVALMVMLTVPQALLYDYFIVQSEEIGRKKGY